MKTKKLLTQCSILSMLAFCAAPPAMAMLDASTDALNRRASSPNTSTAFDSQKECAFSYNLQDLEKALNDPHTTKLSIMIQPSALTVMTNEEAQRLGTALSTNQTLKTLFQEAPLSLTRTAYIADGLRTNTTLEELVLSDISPQSVLLRDEGAIMIAEALEANPRTALRQLTLKSNNNMGRDSAVALGKSLAKNETIQNLTLGSRHFGSDGLCSIMTALTDNREIPLHTLNLSDSQFDEESAYAMARFLENSKTLQTLELSSAYIPNKGIQAIIAALAANPRISLHTLNLSYNQFDEESAYAMARFLETSRTLKVLRFTNAGITDKMSAVIGHGIGLNNSLETLDLSCNKIGEEGVRSLLTALDTNTSVKSISLNSNAFRGSSISDASWFTGNPNSSRLKI